MRAQVVERCNGSPTGPASPPCRPRSATRPAGFGKVTGPVMAAAMRRANVKDLARLKALLEGPAGGRPGG